MPPSLPPSADPAVRIHGLQHHFGAGALRRRVLDGIELEIGAGELVLLTGPSGSGKTTLLTLIGGLRSAQSGSLRVLGRELAGAGPKQLTLARRDHSYIFQAHNLHRSLTALENVRMALEMRGDLEAPVMERRSRAILAAVGLDRHRHAYPGELSGGQKQRVAREQGCTILMVTHDSRILDVADRIVAMEDGQLGSACR